MLVTVVVVERRDPVRCDARARLISSAWSSADTTSTKPCRIAPEIRRRQAGIEPALSNSAPPMFDQRAAHMRTVGAGRFTEHVAELTIAAVGGIVGLSQTSLGPAALAAVRVSCVAARAQEVHEVLHPATRSGGFEFLQEGLLF